MRNDKHIDSNWAELPIDVLNSIIDKLIMIDDYVKFGAVCVSWRTVFDEDVKKKKLSQSSSIPFLLVPPHDHIVIEEEDDDEEEEHESYHTSIIPPSTYNGQVVFRGNRMRRRLIPQTRSLYNVFSQKVCGDFDVQLSHDYYCRGSSFGWLVITKPIIHECSYYYKYDVQLYNPFVSDKHNTINLPSIEDTIIQYLDSGYDDLYQRPLSYLRKAVLSCNPLFACKGNNFVLMAIVSEVWKLSFYTPENKDWTTINWEREDWSYFEDLIYFNKTQQFYAALSNGAVLAIDLIKEAGVAPLIVPKLTQVAPPTHEGNGQRYLVETSSGELLQVCKQFDYFPSGSSSNNYDTIVEFQVFKLDPSGLAWSQIHDMGDTVLFLGDNSSISRTASNFPGCKPNCIYYTDDMSTEREVGVLDDPQYMGVYNLADGTQQPIYPTATTITFPAPIWLEPTLPRSIVYDT